MALTQKLVRELLDYNPKTGVLTWRSRDLSWFNGNVRICRGWNTKCAGKAAGCLSSSPKDYCVIGILGQTYLAHIVIWLWMTGKFPEYEIDHRDHNQSNNRWKNLRDVPHAINRKNQKKMANNTSGHTGIRKTKAGKYETWIHVNGQRIGLGNHNNLTKAIAIRKAAQVKYGFTKNHGF